MKLKIFILAFIALPFIANAQLGTPKNEFTKADTLRGSLNENRDWWDVLRYDIEVKPDYEQKSITGKVSIQYKNNRSVDFLKDNGKKWNLKMQIDLQAPLIVDSVIREYWLYKKTTAGKKILEGIGLDRFLFEQQGNVCFVHMPLTERNMFIDSIIIYYHGTPKAAKNAPWDGGWIWSKDSLGRPWMTAAVQGLGASAWYPCKDYQGDEPDNGASLTIVIPDTLVGVSNGISQSDLQFAWMNDDSSFEYGKTVSTTWAVKNPINNYNIIPYIGKYVNWTDTLNGEQGKLDLSFWVLDYNLERSKKQFTQAKSMLRCFEYWFGPYPFYEDGYKLVDAPHLGMEHQSAVAYGNKYRNGYLGRDLSGTGWGTKWDFIIVHESGHEWFGNNITTKDVADMWVHEGFTNYSETLYTEWLFGKQAGDDYNYGIRKNIRNDIPIIGPYGVNKEGSSDMYYKAGNMLHTIRKVIDNDEKFRQILRGLNTTFRHQTVTTQQIETYITRESGIDFRKTFDQYLRTTQIPVLEFSISKDNRKLSYRWTNCVDGFNLPLVIGGKRHNITTKWNTTKPVNNELSGWNTGSIQNLYYITAKQVTKP